MTLQGWSGVATQLTPAQETQLLQSALKQLTGTPAAVLRDTAAAQNLARQALMTEAQRAGLLLSGERLTALTRQAAAQVGGLGFLEALIYERTDLSEIAVNPDGSVWLLRKGAPAFEPCAHRPTRDEVWRAAEALLTPLGRSFSEATPSVDARLPRDPARHFTGARLKLVHPALAPGQACAGETGYPALNIRLYESRPVLPAQIVAWGMAPAAVVDGLVELVGRAARVLIIGGTASGKTTLLAALCAGIPGEARVVKIEDPEEIYLDPAVHPNLVTLEARSAPPGSSVPDYTVKDGVDDALRMSPRWLIVGEVRKGDAALALFRAQMSDHPGLSTFHAESPAKAVARLGIIMYADLQVDIAAGYAVFVEAIDLVVQVGMRPTPTGPRRLITGAWEVEPELRDGGVIFRTLYQAGGEHLDKLMRR